MELIEGRRYRVRGSGGRWIGPVEFHRGLGEVVEFVYADGLAFAVDERRVGVLVIEAIR